jgi:colanic acid/amylovoran biosynthesis glycosyltransferase
VLLEAFSLLQQRGYELKLDLIGEGFLRATLEESVRKLEIGIFVSFLGQIKQEDLYRRYQEKNYDLVVLPSIKSSTGQEEGIPVSLIEAMSFGVPVIATNTGSISELIPLNLNLLVQPGDSDELAAKIAEIIEMSPITRMKLVKSCQVKVWNEFNIETTAQLWSKWLRLQVSD